MKKLLAFVALISLSAAALATGWSELWGVTSRGDRIDVSPSRDWKDPSQYSAPWSNDLYHVVYSANGIRGNRERIYEDQLCMFALDKSGDWAGFACAKNGTSPLAGAAYKVTFINGCDFSHRFVCVSGCTSDAPKEMRYGWWEGPIRDECPNAQP